MSFRPKGLIPETLRLRVRSALRFLADHVDWELLPGFMQDAVDHMLAEEARAEPGESIPLRDAMRETGDLT